MQWWWSNIIIADFFMEIYYAQWMITSFSYVSVSISVRLVHAVPTLWWRHSTCPCLCPWGPWGALSASGPAEWESEDSSCPSCSSSCAQSGTWSEPSLSQLGGVGGAQYIVWLVHSTLGKGRHSQHHYNTCRSMVHHYRRLAFSPDHSHAFNATRRKTSLKNVGVARGWGECDLWISTIMHLANDS